MRFKLDGKVYSTASLDEISLRDLVLFNTQAEEIGLTRKWSDVERVAHELETLPAKEADLHPEKLLVIAVTIWASRRLAGDQLTFGEAIDFPTSHLEWLPEPEDRKPGKGKGAKKAPAKKSTRTSAPAAAAPVAAPATT